MTGREGTSVGTETRKRKNARKLLVFLSFLAAVIAAVQLLDLSRYVAQENLRSWIGGRGALAPIIYVVFYAVASALFLPGLPITVAGGILFGPFWGILCAIAGATAGASLSFLVARYLARDWVEGRLSSPRWRRLDGDVKRHGWKVVAFTRLIPLFPYNLLNYAFGLTGIRFWQYAVTSFFFMLPACIAYVVFSSSLLDLLRGRISPTLVIGVILVILVSVVPLIYQRHRAAGKEEGRQ